MMRRIQDLLDEGIRAARTGEEDRAQLRLTQVLTQNASRAQQATAHFWLAELAADDAEKREHLEMALALEPQNAQARRMLAIMDGKLKPEDIVSGDALPSAPPKPLRARRFVCPQCGGRMQFAAREDRLTCDYCGHQMPLLRALQSGMNIEEQDFAVGLATADGHTKSDAPRAFTCQGCQATLVSRQQHSLTCPYCGSHHVIDAPSRNLVAPQVMLLFSVAQSDARRALQEWVETQVIGQQYQTSRVRGIYLPAWTFDITSERPWRMMRTESAPAPGALPAITTYEGREAAFHDDIVVPATHLLPYTLREAFEDFDLNALTPYDDACLANHPATLHTITLAEASLAARRKAYQQAEQQPPPVQSANRTTVKEIAPPIVTVLSYKLVLLPFWIGNYRYKGKVYLAVINGQNGKVRGQSPPGLLEKALGGVL
ncbi:MAG TPA: TFIIB-type zinc finger domain-containing protein [Anaerolineae bacterium]|nr:TFIIB-type zinc finger domain-containing protein [Anaerolineae bacterium]HQI84175.1 TFIIB-type zinc finger domain-containing protein [Anaerolineae bacterium]